MNKSGIAGVVLFLVALIGFLLFLSPSPDQTGQAVSELGELDSVTGNKTDGKSVIPVKGPEMVLRLAAPLETEGHSKGIGIELDDLSGLEAGDAIAVYVPEEKQRYTGDVSEVNTTSAGNQVITGFLEVGKNRHRFIFTVGRHQTFGTIQTGQGRYQLETRNGVGRIISVATINEQLDFSQPDYVIPERRALPPEETVPERN